jgi:hypothetical protein
MGLGRGLALVAVVAAASVALVSAVALAAPGPASGARPAFDIDVSVPPRTSPSPTKASASPSPTKTSASPSPTKSSASPSPTQSSATPAPTSTSPGSTSTTPTRRATTGGAGGTSGGGATPSASPAAQPCVQTEPAIPSTPNQDAAAAAVDKDIYLPGSKVTASVAGFEAGEREQLVLFSEPHLIGNFTADHEGQVEAVFAVADDAPPGTHTVQFTGWCGVVKARADVLVGVPADEPQEAAPTWLWWLLILLALVVVALAARRVIQLRRDRAATAEAPTP